MKKNASQFTHGFTILEMLMVLAIFGIMTAVIVFKYGEFNSKTVMKNMAYEVALSIREAQVYSLGVRGQANSTEFDNHYGVYFSQGYEKDYAFFIDKVDGGNPPNGICDENGTGDCLACVTSSECLAKNTLTRDIQIHLLCVSASNDPVNTVEGTCNGDEVGELTVTFDRPNPDAIIVTGTTPRPGFSAGIVLITSQGNKHAVIIRPTGQVSVQYIED